MTWWGVAYSCIIWMWFSLLCFIQRLDTRHLSRFVEYAPECVLLSVHSHQHLMNTTPHNPHHPLLQGVFHREFRSTTEHAEERSSCRCFKNLWRLHVVLLSIINNHFHLLTATFLVDSSSVSVLGQKKGSFVFLELCVVMCS